MKKTRNTNKLSGMSYNDPRSLLPPKVVHFTERHDPMLPSCGPYSEISGPHRSPTCTWASPPVNTRLVHPQLSTSWGFWEDWGWKSSRTLPRKESPKPCYLAPPQAALPGSQACSHLTSEDSRSAPQCFSFFLSSLHRLPFHPKMAFARVRGS